MINERGDAFNYVYYCGCNLVEEDPQTAIPMPNHYHKFMIIIY